MTAGTVAARAGTVRGTAARAGRAAAPDLAHESAWLAEGVGLVAGMDEVGRGALAGPVTVGCAVVGTVTVATPFPDGLTDSKALTARRREVIEPLVASWLHAWGVGHASPAEIDEIGIVGALRRAGLRALRAAEQVAGPVRAVVLDGSHDWLTGGGQADLLTPEDPEDDGTVREVRTVVKGDLRCASVSAASVLAKQARDRLMADAHVRHPGYGWDSNKGYGSGTHLAELRRVGPCDEHRRSWRLPEQDADADRGLVLVADADGG